MMAAGEGGIIACNGRSNRVSELYDFGSRVSRYINFQAPNRCLPEPRNHNWSSGVVRDGRFSEEKQALAGFLLIRA